MFHYILSLLIVAFGQPATSAFVGLLAATVGYAIFWKLLLDLPKKKRFWLSCSWFTAVSLIQLYWLTSHPYAYIYLIYFLLALGMGLQFGLIGIFITRERLRSLPTLFGIAGLWTLLEWVRLLPLSGFSFNPVGLAYTGYLYPLQMASLWGIYGLSFWVIFVNLLALRGSRALFAAAALVPVVYGFVQIQLQRPSSEHYSALLIQTGFPSEETMGFASHKERIAYVLEEWRQILKLAKTGEGKKIDLIALPEFVVPYGTYSPVFPHQIVASTFKEIFGPDAVLPPLEPPFAENKFVTNGYWLQALANHFGAEVVAGLEDADDDKTFYSSAILVKPHGNGAERYEKRILMPMGEYIPFRFCRALAASYGIHGSFTPGVEAKILGSIQPLGLSICYEETFGHLMRENSQKGAKMMVNLTNDGWYPLSTLPEQHLSLARVRTVENGLPLLRACNTGITAGIDSNGRLIAALDNTNEAPGALHVSLPLSTYWTPYRLLGDFLIVGVSLFSLIFLRKLD